MADNPVGRPSKYKPEYCDQLREHMAQGFSLESFGGVVKVCRATLYEWAEVHPDFSDAIKEGKTASQLKWEQALQAAVVNPKGMNVTPVIFALKCRFGFKETQAIEHSGPDGKPIEHKNLSDLTDEQLNEKFTTLMAKVQAGEVKE
jgi:hypothetical protein